MTSELTVQRRIRAIGDAQMIPFALMSLTYEPLFFLAIFSNIYHWIQVEHGSYITQFRDREVNIYYKLFYNIVKTILFISYFTEISKHNIF